MVLYSLYWYIMSHYGLIFTIRLQNGPILSYTLLSYWNIMTTTVLDSTYWNIMTLLLTFSYIHNIGTWWHYNCLTFTMLVHNDTTMVLNYPDWYLMMHYNLKFIILEYNCTTLVLHLPYCYIWSTSILYSPYWFIMAWYGLKFTILVLNDTTPVLQSLTDHF